ncbi:twin-arginine translocation signal domain-containing protein [Natronosalvus rutilus]|uniref:Twin-arginine translocation signal domain-containing protein n=1 Tax=Natronosalvus rutilus TaxID=2953753 RepID=A0A9E7NFN1_9EURY|nr:twin-arginine translocation signal domain-containing protein [Natronosalvus rutilus]UTF56029.1 twin-arginine translocation signal domain-containing protein [Natronosalvus rutilus]
MKGSDNNINRRNFLRAAAASGATIGIVGTAAASTNFNFIDSATWGNTSGANVAKIQLMARYENNNAQTAFDHAEDTFGDYWNLAGDSDFDGLALYCYDHDSSMSWDISLQELDGIISDHWTDGNDRIKVWNCDEVDSYGGDCNVQCAENLVNVCDPALTSSDIYPPITGFPGDDGLGHNNMHVRVTNGEVVTGRLTRGALMALTRVNAFGEWNDLYENVPDRGNTYHYEAARSVNTSGDKWAPTAMGIYSKPEMNNEDGSCGGSTVPSDYQLGDEYLRQITACTSFLIRDAADYFR